MARETVHQESLEEEANHVIEEARMVLPGIQALFGFQLIAVFNQGFTERLPQAGRVVHLAALILVAVSIALIMAPAAYHRLVERDRVTRQFTSFASRMIACAMLPLLLAISLEVGLVTQVILHSMRVSVVCGAALAALFVWLWFAYPAHLRRQRGRHPRASRDGRSP